MTTAFVRFADLFTEAELRAVHQALVNETVRVVSAEGVESPKMVAIREACDKVAFQIQRLEQTLQLADVAA